MIVFYGNSAEFFNPNSFLPIVLKRRSFISITFSFEFFKKAKPISGVSRLGRTYMPQKPILEPSDFR
jgi:hypothetical protein